MVVIFEQGSASGSTLANGSAAGCGGSWSLIANGNYSNAGTDFVNVNVFCAPATTPGSCQVTATAGAGTPNLQLDVLDIANGNGCNLDGSASSDNGNSKSPTVDAGTATTTGVNDILVGGLASMRAAASGFAWSGSLSDTNGTNLAQDAVGVFTPSWTLGYNLYHQPLTSASTYKVSNASSSTTTTPWAGAQAAIQMK
jgi:hypothetical protein